MGCVSEKSAGDPQAKSPSGIAKNVETKCETAEMQKKDLPPPHQPGKQDSDDVPDSEPNDEE